MRVVLALIVGLTVMATATGIVFWILTVPLGFELGDTLRGVICGVIGLCSLPVCFRILDKRYARF